jgi:hypothetical protein
MELQLKSGRGTVPPARTGVSGLPGREAEVSRILDGFEGRNGPRQPVQMLLGDSGTGKSTLIRLGLIPAAVAAAAICVRTAAGATPRSLIHGIASETLRHHASEGQFAGRLKQFCLLLEQDSPEAAAEYLADCAWPRAGRILLVIDQLERLETGDERALADFLQFVNDLGATGSFSILLTARTDSGQAIWRARRRSRLPAWPHPVVINDLPVRAVTCFRVGSVPVDIDFRDWLMATVRDWPGVLRFAGKLLGERVRDHRGAGHIDLPPAERSAAMGELFAAAAEHALRGIPEAQIAEAFSQLMGALFPSDGDLARSKTIAVRDLDPVVAPLIDPLVDAGILRKGGCGIAVPITIQWSWAPGIANWPRAAEWISEKQQLDSRLALFESSLGAWESDGRTPVRLLHAGPHIDGARKMLSLPWYREQISGQMLRYLEESITLDERLREQMRQRQNRKHWLIGGAAAATVAGIVLAILSVVR